ncbi:MAG: tRNA-dihydrouridine synthase [bacterium]|nr:tRNA-dihydrouridine synthase [bacterium]
MKVVTIGKTEFSSPIFLASGTAGYGYELSEFVDFRKIGAVVTKGVSKNPREGNPPPRVGEFVVYGVAVGLVNTIGLQNPGAKNFKKILSEIKKLPTKVVVNVFGESEKEYGEVINILEDSEQKADAYELNLSCPNTKKGGMEFGVNPKAVSKIVKLSRKKTELPIIVKFSPFSELLKELVKISMQEGADAFTLTNTIPSAIRDYKVGFLKGGLSGPVLKPIALRCVLDVKEVFPDAKIIACGGISTREDIKDFIDAGACAVQIGTASFLNPKISEILHDQTVDSV